MKATITGMQIYARVAIEDVEPYATEVILSGYERVTRQFIPTEVSIVAHVDRGGIDYPSAEVHGMTEGTRRPGALTRHARIKLAEDTEGSIEHWPAYARAALTDAVNAVKL